jgi:antitoxin ParD1/3/4
MHLSLTPELEHLVQEKVKSGRYLSASEVVQEALRLLEERDALRAQQLEDLRQAVAVGLEQLDRGEAIPGDQVFEELREQSRNRQREQS